MTEISIEHMASDRSRAAATRAYRELRRCGVADLNAFEAALRVYRYHHPETGSREACWVVAGWITEALDA